VARWTCNAVRDSLHAHPATALVVAHAPLLDRSCGSAKECSWHLLMLRWLTFS
jgi:hypothetical protein